MKYWRRISTRSQPNITLNFGLKRRALPSFNTASALLSRRSIGHSATRCADSQVARTLSNMKTHRFSGLFFDLYGTILVYGDMKMAWKEWFDSIRESLKGFGVKVEKDCLRKICTGFFSKPEPPMDGVKGLTPYERRMGLWENSLESNLQRERCQTFRKGVYTLGHGTPFPILKSKAYWTI